MEHLLTALYALTLKEAEGTLTMDEANFYVYCVETLRIKNIEIPFAIEL